ncbi:hypothetical protein [Tardiphaga sp. 367_B4_N1_1]|uniref:hypothetical protein n=1 Tax=Tardiphaga sp. 367_B4_N1_1 TaxID=3240777 RepID=UPI003F27D011
MHSAIPNGIFTATFTNLDSAHLSDRPADAVSPLIYWRTRRPDQMCRKDSASIRFALSGSRLDCESRWLRAILGDGDGDETVAMHICLRQIKNHPIDAPEVDLAVSATLANALLGKSTSAIFLSWVLKYRAKIDPRCALYSDLWLLADF